MDEELLKKRKKLIELWVWVSSLWMLFIVLCIIIGKLIFPPSEPLVFDIKDFKICEARDEENNSIIISETLPSNTKTIVACGYMDKNISAMTFSIHWYHKKRLVFNDIKQNFEDPYFQSTLEIGTGTLAEGEYLIELVVGKNVETNIKTAISQED